MSAIPTDLRVKTVEEPRRQRGLPASAAVYGVAVGIAAMCVAVPFVLRIGGESSSWSTFIVRTARDSSFHTSWVFLIPAAMLLPPGQMALLGVVMHVPEWLKERYPWYIQSFNICNYTIGNLVTWAVAHSLLHATNLIPNEDLRWAIAGAAACVTAVAANHIVLAPMVTLARGHSIRESGVFSFESLSTDFIVSTLGLAFAAFWTDNPW